MIAPSPRPIMAKLTTTLSTMPTTTLTITANGRMTTIAPSPPPSPLTTPTMTLTITANGTTMIAPLPWPKTARLAEAEAERERAEREATGTGMEATGRPLSVTDAEFKSNQERERREREAFLMVVYTACADGRVRLSIENRRDDDDGHPTRASLWCDTPLGPSSDLYDAPPNGPCITGEMTCGDNDDDGGGGGIGRNGLFFQPRHRGDFVVRLLTSGTAAPPGGTVLALNNYCDDGGDAAGKARGRAEDGGIANAGLDGLLMPPSPARLSGAAAATATETSSYSRMVVPHPHRRQNDDNTAAAANVTNETMTTPNREKPPGGSGLSASMPDIPPRRPASRTRMSLDC